jgi:transcription antitermination factor NusA-like protein
VEAWIFQTDIYRIEKAINDAGPDEKIKLRAHLRRAEASLYAVGRRAVTQ